MKIKNNDKIQIFDTSKFDGPNQKLLFGFSCINCINYDMCLKSKKERQQCTVNSEITDILPDYSFYAKIETDSTKIFVDSVSNNDAEDTRDTLKEISQDYTNNEIKAIRVPRPRIPFKDIKQNGRY